MTQMTIQSGLSNDTYDQANVFEGRYERVSGFIRLSNADCTIKCCVESKHRRMRTIVSPTLGTMILS